MAGADIHVSVPPETSFFGKVFQSVFKDAFVAAHCGNIDKFVHPVLHRLPLCTIKGLHGNHDHMTRKRFNIMRSVKATNLSNEFSS